MSPAVEQPRRLQVPWFPVAIFGTLVLICYAPTLKALVAQWIEDPDMGHGFFVPLVAGYIVWQRRDQLLAIEARPNWWGLAVAIWSTSILSTGTTVRTVSVPMQFVNVPSGMHISTLSADRLEVQVRGNAWLMDSVGLTRLVASFNLHSARAGTASLPVDSGNLNLPPGIVMERVSPATVTVALLPNGR